MLCCAPHICATCWPLCEKGWWATVHGIIPNHWASINTISQVPAWSRRMRWHLWVLAHTEIDADVVSVLVLNIVFKTGQIKARKDSLAPVVECAARPAQKVRVQLAWTQSPMGWRLRQSDAKPERGGAVVQQSCCETVCGPEGEIRGSKVPEKCCTSWLKCCR